MIQLRRSPGTVTDEDRRQWKKNHYEKNKQSYIKKARKWQEENPERYAESKLEYFSREDVKTASRIRTREWAKNNKEKKKSYDDAWKEQNRAVVRSYKAKRRAKERKATPSWLTDAHYAAIKAVYEEAYRLSQETGVEHQVDHIVPLSGKTVSGLHVPWNLRAIPAEENQRRPRIWDHNTQI